MRYLLLVLWSFWGPMAMSQDIRVMSYNIRYATAPDGINAWSNRKEFLLSTIEKFRPDLLGTQETLLVQKQFLEEKLSGYSSFGAGREDGKNRGEMAALFYRDDRFEKLEGGHFWLSEKPETVASKGWDAALPRIATWVRLQERAQPDSRPILFLNTHFDHKGEQARQQSAKLIRQRLEDWSQSCRLIVTGDFNAGANSTTYHNFFSDKRLLLDTYRQKYPEASQEEGTFSGFQASRTQGERIDWIACSPDFEILEAGIDRTARDGRTPSDHFPVTAVLRSAK